MWRSRYSVGERLAECRAANEHFVDLSFESIVGFRANGALPHYTATAEASSPLEAE
jgi:Xaa-Pro aminopeptidase